MDRELPTWSEWLARCIVAARRRQSLTQDDVAAGMRDLGFGWDRATVSRLESGSRQLLHLEALALGEVLQVSLTPEVDVELTDSATWTNGGVERHEGAVGRSDVLRMREIISVIGPDFTASLLAAAKREQSGEATRRAARALGYTPLQVAALARHRWGRSFEAERDARSKGRDRRHRGEATQALTSELAAAAPR